MPANKPHPPSSRSSSGRHLKPSKRAMDGGYIAESTKKREARLQKEAKSQAEEDLGSEPEYDPHDHSLSHPPDKWQSPTPTGHAHVDLARRNTARSEWLIAAIDYRNGVDFEAELASGEITSSTLEQIWAGKSLDSENHTLSRLVGSSMDVNVGFPVKKISFGTRIDTLNTATLTKSKNRTGRTGLPLPHAPARFSPLHYPVSSKAAGKKRARSPEDEICLPPPAKVARQAQEHPHRSMQQRTFTPEHIPAPRRPFAMFFSQPARLDHSSALASKSSARRPSTGGLRVYTGPGRTHVSHPRSESPTGPPARSPRPLTPLGTPAHCRSNEEAPNTWNASATSPEDHTHRGGPRQSSARSPKDNRTTTAGTGVQNRPGVRHKPTQRQSRVAGSSTPRMHDRDHQPCRQTPQYVPQVARNQRNYQPANAHRVGDDDEPNPGIDDFGNKDEDMGPQQLQDPNKPVLQLFYPLELRCLVRAVSDRVVARILADGTYTDVLLADDENPNYVSLLEEIAGEEWAAASECRPLRNEYTLGLIHIKYLRGLVTSWRARIKERILVEFRSRFSLGKDRQETCQRVNKLLPDAFHSNQESNVHGLFKSDVIHECVRLAVYFNKQCFGARFPEYFKPIPLGLIAMVTAIANHVIGLFESGTFRPRSLNVREQAPIFAYYLDYLEKMEDSAPQRLENIQLAVRDYCIGSLPKSVVLNVPPPRERRQMTPDSPHRFKPINFHDGSSESEADEEDRGEAAQE